MPAPATPPRKASVIVILGAMNPLVHTPQFYRSVGAMDETELQASLKMPLTSSTATNSQFQFGTPPITINCQPVQWLMQSDEIGSWERMLKIVALVFGKIGGTPISSYGLVVQSHADTSVADVKSAVAVRIRGMKLGFPEGKSSASNIELVVNEADYIVTTSVQPSVLGEQALYMFYQRLYQLPPTDSESLVLETILRGRTSAFDEGAKKFFDAALAGLASMDDKV